MKLFEELKRRNVFRVAGVYAVVGWLMAQVSSTLENAIGLPAWFDGMVVALLLIGFPIAMILAWAFEMTPEGVKLTANVPEGESIAPKTGRGLDFVIIGGLALVGAMIVADRLTPENAAPATGATAIAEASIAVLPFVDMSAAGDQEYFGDGIAEEILNVLAKSESLKVAGRTSSFQFKGKAEDLRAIGNTLGVANVLEGSIRKDGVRVRITAQLIRASDGFHLWSETYDRDLTDIFRVQEEIANSIADAMQTPLGLKLGALETARTQNSEAYDLFLKGNAEFARRGEGLVEAAKDFESAVSLDPDFAAAWANLAVVYSTTVGWFDKWEGRPLRMKMINARAEHAAAKAIALNPDLAASQHALGITLRDRWQWARSEDAFVKALAAEPNATPILEDYSELLGFLGRWKEAAEVARKLAQIDPMTAQFQSRLMSTSWDLQEYDAAIAAFERRRELSPESFNNDFLSYVNLIAEARGLDAAAAFLASCKNCPERYPGVARRLVDAARAGDRSAFTASDLASIDGGEHLKFLIGGEDAVMDSLEYASFNQYYVAVNYGSKPVRAVRATPRYKRLVKDIGMDEYWRERGWPSFCHPVGKVDFQCTAEPMKP